MLDHEFDALSASESALAASTCPSPDPPLASDSLARYQLTVRSALAEEQALCAEALWLSTGHHLAPCWHRIVMV